MVVYIENSLDGLGYDGGLQDHPLLVLDVGDFVLFQQISRVGHVEQVDLLFFNKLSKNPRWLFLVYPDYGFEIYRLQK